MSPESELEYYVENPDRLLNLCREVLERLHTGAGGEAAKQLQAVSSAIEQCQRQGAPVPDDLRAVKLRLLDALACGEKNADKLRGFADGLEQLARDATFRLQRNRPAPPRKPQPDVLPGKAHSVSCVEQNHTVTPTGKTPTETWRRMILEVLKANGGRATVDEVLQAIEERMQGHFLPGDLETIQRSDGRTCPSWQNNARQQRDRMVQEGLLRGDSPRGVWELP